MQFLINRLKKETIQPLLFSYRHQENGLMPHHISNTYPQNDKQTGNNWSWTPHLSNVTGPDLSLNLAHSCFISYMVNLWQVYANISLMRQIFTCHFWRAKVMSGMFIILYSPGDTTCLLNRLSPFPCWRDWPLHWPSALNFSIFNFFFHKVIFLPLRMLQIIFLTRVHQEISTKLAAWCQKIASLPQVPENSTAQHFLYVWWEIPINRALCPFISPGIL